MNSLLLLDSILRDYDHEHEEEKEGNPESTGLEPNLVTS